TVRSMGPRHVLRGARPRRRDHLHHARRLRLGHLPGVLRQPPLLDRRAGRQAGGPRPAHRPGGRLRCVGGRRVQPKLSAGRKLWSVPRGLGERVAVHPRRLGARLPERH
ncbi:unnamed protein product, partial [Prorocentrum cordatum]